MSFLDGRNGLEGVVQFPLDDGDGTNNVRCLQFHGALRTGASSRYYDITAKELLYQTFDGVGWMTGPDVVDGTGNAGEHSSIAVGTDGVHIAYYGDQSRPQGGQSAR